MSKRKSKATTKASKAKAITRASAAKAAVTKSSASPTASSVPLIVLGYDDQQKPRGARFDHDKPDLVTKAAELLGLKVYKTSNPDVAAIVQKLPVGRLYANGRGFVPNVRQDLYTKVVVALAVEPDTAVNPDGDKDSLPVACGLPRTWDEIAPGHLVIAQESLENGWWEAIVIDRKDETLTLRFRDYPHLPQFVRHLSAIALPYAPNKESRPDAHTDQA